MASKSTEKLIRTNLKYLRGDNISAIRSRRHGNASRTESNKSFERTKLFELLTRKKIRPGDPASGQLLEKTLPELSTPSVNYFVMQYLHNTKCKVSFDPIRMLSHFVVPGRAVQSSSEKLPESKEHTEQEQGPEGEISTGNVGESSNFRLEILKMRAAQRTSKDDSKDTILEES